jgi:hypothetical protein
VSEYNQEMKRNIRSVRPQQDSRNRVVIEFGDWYAQQLYSNTTTQQKKHVDFSPLDGAALQHFQSIFPTVQVFNLHDDEEEEDSFSRP